MPKNTSERIIDRPLSGRQSTRVWGSVSSAGSSTGLPSAIDTPGTLSATTTNVATGNHTHAIDASAAPGAAEYLLKSSSIGLLTLPLLAATTSVTTPSILSTGNLSIVPTGGNTTVTGTGTVTSTFTVGANTVNATAVAEMRSNADYGSTLKVYRNNSNRWNVDFSSADLLSFVDATTSTSRFAMTLAGNAMIGTTTDNGYKLDVAGTMRATTSLTTPLLTTATNVDLIINPAGTGAVQFPNDQTLRTTSFDSSFPITGWQINEVSGISGYSSLTIGKIQADELAVRVFVADEVRVDRGDEYWTKSYGIVATTFATPSTIGGTVSVKFEDSPALAGAIFTNNDWVLIRKLDIDTGITLSNVWGQVATYVNNSDGTQNWTFTLRSGPTSESITKGSLAIDFGASGAALIHLSVIDSAGAPYIKMRKWAGANPYTPSNFTTYIQLGQLGSTGNSYYTPSGYGLYIRSTAAEDQFMVADDNGLQIRGPSISLYNSTTQTILMDNTSGINIREDVWGSWDNRRALQWWPDVASMSGDPSLSMYTGKVVGGLTANQNFSYIDANPTGNVLAGLSITAFGQGTATDATLYLEGGSQSLTTTPSITMTATNIDMIGAVDVTGSLSVGGTAVSLSGHTHSYLPLAGGTLSGTVITDIIRPATHNTNTVGTASYYYNAGYFDSLYVNTIVGPPSYSHTHSASDITSGTLDFARIPTTWTGALTLDADAAAGNSNYLRLATQTSTKFWDLIGRAHDYATSAQQNDLLLTYYDGSSTYIVWQADNATRVIDFSNTPTVGGTDVSLHGHTHSARTLTSSNYYYPENYSDNVQSAIDAATATGGTVVLSGFYSISAALSMKSNVTIEGIGWDKSGINTTGNIDAIVFDGPAYKRSMTLRNFKINLGSSTGHHIHFTAYEPWAITIEDMQLTGGTNSFIKVDTDVNPFEVTVQRIRMDSSTLTNPAIDWLGGGSGCTMDRLYIEPGSGAFCEGLHLYNGNFTIGTIITGNGVHRAVRVEYARANIELIHYEPVTALSSHATDIVRTGTGVTIGWIRIGGVVVASGLAGNSKPYYVYYVGHETPASEFGPVQLYSSLETGGSIVYCPDDKSQSEVQLYHGPQSDIDNNSHGLVVSTGELTRTSLLSYMQTQLDPRYVNVSGDTMTGTLYGTGIKQGTAPGGGLLGYSTEFYHNVGMIQNAANPTLSTVAYSYSTPASPYNAFTLDVRGNSADGVQRQMAQLVVNVGTTTNNSESATISLKTRLSGTLAERLKIGGTYAADVTGTLRSTGAIYADAGVTTSAGNLGLSSAGGNVAVTGALTGSSTGVFTSTLTAASDTDAINTFGRVRLGYAVATDTASFAHFDHNSSTSFALSQSAAGATVLNAASGQTISLGNAGSATVTVSASGIDLQSGKHIGSYNYASQSAGWRVDSLGGGDFRYLYADQLHVKAFIADLEQALAGGQIISKSVAVLASDFVAPYAGGTQLLTVEDLPSASNMAVFEANDIVGIRSFSRAGGSLTVSYCFGTVTNYADGAGVQSWTFTRSGTTTYNAITQRGTATSNSTSSGTSTTVTKPTGVISGDVMLAVVTHDGAADTITATGWTIIGTYTSGTDINFAMYYRVAGGAEGSNYSFSTVSSHALAASIVAYYNVATPIFDDYSISTNSASTSMTGATVFGTATANMLVFLGGITNNSSVTPASGMTELIDAGSTGIRVYVAHQTLAASGETGSKVATIAASHASIVGMVALRPTYSAMTAAAGQVVPGTTIEADTLVLDFGIAGNGYYEVTAVDGAYGSSSPYAQVVTYATHPAVDGVARVRMGNLTGVSGASAGEYGLYAGSGTIATTAQYMRISTAGVQLNNIPIKLYNTGTQTVNIDSAGTDIWVGPSSSDKRLTWNGTTLALKDSDVSLYSGVNKVVGINPTYGLDYRIGSAYLDEIPTITWRATAGTGNALARVAAYQSAGETGMDIRVVPPDSSHDGAVSIVAYNYDGSNAAGIAFDTPAVGTTAAALTIYGNNVTFASNPLTVTLTHGDLDMNGNDIIDIGNIVGNISTWTTLTLNTGGSWANYGGSYFNAGYKKIGDMVFLRGLVKRTSGSNATIATLPSGTRPSSYVLRSSAGDDLFARIIIQSDGVMTLSTGTAVSYLSLDGLWFSTA